MQYSSSSLKPAVQPPTRSAGLRQLVSATPKAPQPYEDIFWALLNSTEFMFNH